VRSAEARSAGIRLPNGVTRSFQVSLNNVEPSEAVFACNLLAKADVRATLADETEELGPEMSSVIGTASFTGGGEGLTGAGAGPNRSIITPSCASEGVAPDPDSGEEMALGVTPKIRRLNIDNGSFIHIPWGDMPLLDEFPQPRGGFRVNLVVERLAQCTVSDSIRFFNCSRSAMKFTVICMKIGC